MSERKAIFCVWLLFCVLASASAETVVLKSGNAAIGQRDPLITVVGKEVVIGPGPFTAFAADQPLEQALVIAPLNAGWTSPPEGASWIGVSSDPACNRGGYEYKASFELPQGFDSASFTIAVTADDAFAVYLNDVLVGAHTGPEFHTTLHDFSTSDPAAFRPGQNDLRILVINAVDIPTKTPTGVTFLGTVSYAPDATPPSTPTVTDDGATTTSADQLHAAWSSSDPESGIAEVQYAIGTSASDPGSGYVVGWKSAGTATEATETGLSLQSGQTYYWYVKAKNAAGLWSEVGVSDGFLAGPVGTIHVKTDGDDSNNGLSWEHSLKTVQKALNISRAGDEIWVVAGTYYERVSLKDGVGLYGGFSGAESARDERDWRANATVLDGQHGGSVVTAGAGVTQSTVVDGFVIQNGQASVALGGTLHFRIGGGVACLPGGAPVISNNLVQNNIADYGGGGICCWSDGKNEAVVRNNIISNNSAAYGGGVMLEYSDAVVTKNVIVNNYGLVGGGIYLYIGNADIADNLITNNAARDNGGGVWVDQGAPRINANVIVSNDAPNGGCMWLVNAAPVVTNNILAFGSSGIGRDPEWPSAPVLRHNCFFGNAAYDYSGIPAPTPEDGNVSADPLFQDLANGSYRLAAGSPCIDAGDDSVVEPGALDLDGRIRIFGAHVDIGAYELWDLTAPATPVVTDSGAVTADAAELNASWSSADPESGIAEYQYAIGTSPTDTGSGYIVGWKSAGTATEATETGLSLITGQTYYWYVKAKNGAGLWSEVGVSDGLVVDCDAPTTPTVTDDGPLTAVASQLHASWSATDAESGVAEYEYAIGVTPADPGSGYVVGWKSAGTATEATETGLSLITGQTYYWYVKAKNGAGLWSEVGVSGGVVVDTTPPVPAFVLRPTRDWYVTPEWCDYRDRYPESVHESEPDLYASHWYRTCAFEIAPGQRPDLEVMWFDEIAYIEFSRPESYPVQQLLLGLFSTSPGTPPGVVLPDGHLLDWSYSWKELDVQPGPSRLVTFTLKTTLEGPYNETSLSVRSSESAESPYLVLIPADRAQGGRVMDNGNVTRMSDSLEATFHADDLESGVAEYQYALGLSPTDPGSGYIVPWTSSGTEKHIALTDLSLQHGQTVYWYARAKNGAGLWSDVWTSDGLYIDLRPDAPAIATSPCSDVLHASWSSWDYRPIVEYQYAIGTSPTDPGAGYVVDWTSTGTTAEATAALSSAAGWGPFYWYARARNSLDVWSEVGASGPAYFHRPLLNSGNGHYYEIIPSALAWDAAKAAAEAMEYQGIPGHLATLTSEAENLWASENLAELNCANGTSFWLGGYQAEAPWGVGEPNGGWTWVTGEPWDYTFWKAGQPDNIVYGTGPGYPEEDYLEWNVPTGGWNDLLLSAGIPVYRTSQGYMVEYDADVAPPETEITVGPAEGSCQADTSATFTFAGSDNITPRESLTYSWQLDSGEWSAFDATTTASLAGLSEGQHTFRVKAKDALGNVDATPAERTFTVNTTAPPAPTVADDGLFTGDATQLHAHWSTADPGSVVEWEYAVGTSPSDPGSGYALAWKSAGVATDVVEQGLSLAAGQTYYFYVRGKSLCGAWGAVGASDGIKVGLPVLNPANGHYYEFVPFTGGWNDAKALAEARQYEGRQGYLGTVTSLAEREWINANLAELNPLSLAEILIGGYQLPGSPEPSGGWAWVTDEAWEFTSWRYEEPNDYDGAEDYLMMHTGRACAWDDWPEYAGGFADGFLVEYGLDLTPPTTPIVTDDGNIAADATQLHAAWSSSDPESDIAEYQYAIGISPTDPGSGYLVDWKSAGTATEATEAGLALQANSIYYWYVKARNGAGLWSEVGVSDGIQYAPQVEWPVSQGGNGHLYQPVAVTGGVFWNAADVDARRAGGNLATIASEAENLFVYGLVASNPAFWGPGQVASDFLGPWLGGWQPYGSDAGSGWNWVTGEEFNYTAWAESEPNDPADWQNRLHFLGKRTSAPNWTWSDVGQGLGLQDQHTILGYIVEYDPAWQQVYFSDFESGAGGEWSDRATDVTPGTAAHPADRFLGQFNENTVALDLVSLPDHSSVEVVFDLYVIGSWDGNGQRCCGPDLWQLRADGQRLLYTTFGIWPESGLNQSYPDTYPNGDHAARTGAAEVNTLGFSDFWGGDSSYRLIFRVPHSAPSLHLEFLGAPTDAPHDESWGIDNIQVQVLTEASPPTGPVVTDDGDITTDATQLHATWLSSDPESGIAEYQYAIGTSATDPGSGYLVGWKSAGSATEATEAGLTLQSGQTYYWYVKAKNGGGLWSEVGVSDGILVDATPPSAPVVIVPKVTPLTSLAATVSSADPDVARYEYAVIVCKDASGAAWSGGGAGPDLNVAGMALNPGERRCLAVRAVDHAGLTSEVTYSDYFIAVGDAVFVESFEGSFDLVDWRKNNSACGYDTSGSGKANIPQGWVYSSEDGAGPSGFGELAQGFSGKGAVAWAQDDSVILSSPLVNLPAGTYILSFRAASANLDGTGAPPPVSFTGWRVEATGLQMPQDGWQVHPWTSFRKPLPQGVSYGWTEFAVPFGITNAGPYRLGLMAGSAGGTGNAGQAWLLDEVRVYPAGAAISQVTGETSTTLGWSSVAAGSTGLDWGTTAELGATGEIPGLFTTHTYQQGGLAPDTGYYFHAFSNAAEGCAPAYEAYFPVVGTRPSRTSLDDAGFESGSAGPWTLGRAAAVTGTFGGIAPHSGSWMASCGGNNTRQNGVVRQRVKVNPGWRYRISAWGNTLVTDGAANSARCVLQIDQGGINPYRTGLPAAQVTATQGQWQKMSVDVIAGAGGILTVFGMMEQDYASPGIVTAMDDFAILGDNTSPTQPVVVDDGAFSPDATSLHATWSASDPDTGVAEYLYAIGTAPSDPFGGYLVPWKSAGTATEATETGLNLQPGVTYYWYVKATNGVGQTSTTGASDGIRVDGTPPSTPVVVDQGTYAPNNGRLSASWSATDAESGIAEYQYAIGDSPSDPGSGYLVGWKSSGTATAAQETGLAGLGGRTLYWYVRAQNSMGVWSPVGVSDGIAVVATMVDTPGQAKLSPNNALLGLRDVVVTATAAQMLDRIYVEKQDRSSGLAVQTPAALLEGDVVDIAGRMATTSDGERIIADATVDILSHGVPLQPLRMNLGNAASGSFYFNAATGAGQRGVTDPPGQRTSTVGLLVRVTGLVMDVSSDSTLIFINDGSWPLLTGARVERRNLPALSEWDYVEITGISSIRRAASAYQLFIRPRTISDTVIVEQASGGAMPANLRSFYQGPLPPDER